jgi:hypothetical protein
VGILDGVRVKFDRAHAGYTVGQEVQIDRKGTDKIGAPLRDEIDAGSLQELFALGICHQIAEIPPPHPEPTPEAAPVAEVPAPTTPKEE